MLHWNRHTPRNTKECNVRSKIRWFTEFCNSHYVSHFAAFFIDARTKRSVVESCFKQIIKIICLIVQKKFHKDDILFLGPALANHFKVPKLHTVKASTKEKIFQCWKISLGNDPSAGSPKETLLRILLPLNDQVCPTSRQKPTVANQFPTIQRTH